ncbi:MAG: VWA domain-containing protein [Phycisphaeraceae bacterium]|nr:VWA domain-containing protein [Phycisphaeraceae bacterium]
MKRIAIHRRIVGWRSMLPLLVAALLVPTSASYGAGLLIADGGLGGVLEIKEHRVEVTINNGVAVTTVEQVFVNTERRTVEALYTFPVPKGASVSNFSMWINGKEMTGEVVEKQRAREIYDSYKRQARPKDPGLLEQVDYKTFEMRIFPIAAGAEQRVRVTYSQELDFDHDWATYVYPLATVTRQDVRDTTTGPFALTLRVLSEVPMVEMVSPSHAQDMVVAKHDEHLYQASLETPNGSLARDVVVSFHTARPVTGLDVITSRPKGEDGYFLLTLTAGEELEKLGGPADYVFVLDVSGSMAKDEKLATSLGAVEAFVSKLGPEDRFELLCFNVTARSLFGSLHAADAEGMAQAKAFLRTQEARGGTELAPALRAAYALAGSDRPLNVVILSDGMTEQAERRTLLEMIRQRPAQARVFAVGVGNEVNRPLLEQMTRDAGGLAAFISREDDFERSAEAFRRKLTKPVAEELAIDFGGRVYDVTPEKLPNLYHGSPVRVYGRYRGDGDAEATIRMTVMGRPVEQKVRIDLPKADGGNPQIERMWAWHRVQEILGEADRTGSRQSVLGKVIELGEAYSIVTEYTSFIVLENDAEYQRWQVSRRNALRVQRDEAAQERVREQMAQLRDKASQSLAMAIPAESLASERALGMPLTPAMSASPQQEMAAPAQQQSSSSRSIDLPSFGDSSGGGGGGAIDPITGVCAMLLSGGAWIAARGRKRGPRPRTGV